MYLIKQRIRAHLFVNFALYKYLIIIIIINLEVLYYGVVVTEYKYLVPLHFWVSL